MIRFDGVDYIAERDNPRLTGQLKRIWEVMKSGEWKSLKEIAEITNDPEASISAQLRHLRKERFGKHNVERKNLGNGYYVYRLEINNEKV
jgi:predicted transcriptional regulator